MENNFRPTWAPSDYRSNRSAWLRAEESRKKYSVAGLESWRTSRLDRQASVRSTVSRAASVERRVSRPSLRKAERPKDPNQEVREVLLRDQQRRQRALEEQLRQERATRSTFLAARAMVTTPAQPKTVVWRMPSDTGQKDQGSEHLKADETEPDSETPIEELKSIGNSRTSIDSSRRSISDAKLLLTETDIFEDNHKDSGVLSAEEPRWGVLGIIRSLKNSLFQSPVEQNNINNQLTSIEEGRISSPQNKNSSREHPRKSDFISSTLTHGNLSNTKQYDLPRISVQQSVPRDLQNARDILPVDPSPSSISREQPTSRDYPSTFHTQGSVSALPTQAPKSAPQSPEQVQKSSSPTNAHPGLVVPRDSSTRKENASNVRFQKKHADIIPTRSNLPSTRSLKSTSRELSTAKANSSTARSQKNKKLPYSKTTNAPSRTSQRSTSVTTPVIRKESSALRTTRRSVPHERSRQSISTQDKNNLQRTIKQEDGRPPRTTDRRASSRKKLHDSLDSLEEQIALLEQERRLDVIRRLEETARLKREELAATRFKIRMSLEEEIECNKKLERILGKIRAIREAGEKWAFTREDSKDEEEEPGFCKLEGDDCFSEGEDAET